MDNPENGVAQEDATTPQIEFGERFGPRLAFSSARITLVFALAWRVVAELSRRYQHQYDIRVLEAHPGISIRGALHVTIGPLGDQDRPCLALNIGGESGTYDILRPVGGRLRDPRESPSMPFAGPMLSHDPSAIVDGISAAWGLPRSAGKLPGSHKTTIALRAVAGLLESLVFQRDGWRTTAGFCDNSAVGPMAPDWTAALGVSKELIRAATDGRDPAAASFLTRYVLVHRCSDDDVCLRLDALKGSAWAFCLASGTATRLTAMGPDRVVSLPLRYQAVDRQSDALVHELAAALA